MAVGGRPPHDHVSPANRQPSTANQTMRPGPLLIRLAILLAAASLIVSVLPELVWALVALGAVLLIAAAIEALLLRRVVFRAERQGKLAVPLDERETIVVRLTTTSRRPLRLLIRQRWPELVEPRASVVHAMIRPGEMLPVEMHPRGIARGTATVEPLYVAATMRGLVERIVRAGEPSIVHVLPNLHAVGRMHRPWYDQQRPEPFADALRAAKRAVDPNGVLNPGVLIDA